MFERFTAEARTVVVHAQQHARRLGHRYIGCEHLLLALVAIDAPAGSVLREHGLTPARVEEQIVRRVGLGAAATLFADLDRNALASIGIDLDAVRARIEASFPPDSLTHAVQAVQCGTRPRNRHGGLIRRWRRRRHAQRGHSSSAGTRISPAPASGLYHAPGALATGHLPFTPGAKRTLERSLREALARQDRHVGVEHIAVSLISGDNGAVPPILEALEASGPSLQAAILDRYRQAS